MGIFYQDVQEGQCTLPLIKVASNITIAGETTCRVQVASTFLNSSKNAIYKCEFQVEMPEG